MYILVLLPMLSSEGAPRTTNRTLLRGGSVAKIERWSRVLFEEEEITSQAATWNSPAMNSAWALMSLPLMFRTCPFLIIAIAS